MFTIICVHVLIVLVSVHVHVNVYVYVYVLIFWNVSPKKQVFPRHAFTRKIGANGKKVGGGEGMGPLPTHQIEERVTNFTESPFSPFTQPHQQEWSLEAHKKICYKNSKKMHYTDDLKIEKWLGRVHFCRLLFFSSALLNKPDHKKSFEFPPSRIQLSMPQFDEVGNGAEDSKNLRYPNGV